MTRTAARSFSATTTEPKQSPSGSKSMTNRPNRSSTTIEALAGSAKSTDWPASSPLPTASPTSSARKRINSVVTLKSAREIELMRRSGQITSRVLTELMKAVKPGVATGDLDRLAETKIREAGGMPTFKGYNGFPGSICASINDEVVHGIPGSRVVRDGDLLSIDIGTTLDGYVSDSAATVPIGKIASEALQLLQVT